MKKIKIKKNYWLICLIILSVSCAKKKISKVNIIPKPNSLTINKGCFEITDNSVININSNELNVLAVNISNSIWDGNNEERIKVVTSESKGINLFLKEGFSEEEYELNITEDKLIIYASTKNGIFYGIQTLLQLLPSDKLSGDNLEIFSKDHKLDKVTLEDKKMKFEDIYLPCLNIKDKPAHSYRGFMLDVSRHFFNVDEVKKIINEMSKIKLNRFHWHLTDDQGWRIEIKRYPNLTKIGSVRKETLVGNPYKDYWKFLKENNLPNNAESEEKYTEKYPDKFNFDGKEHSGFYTQEQIKEVVDYARERFIIVVPEIEMPGHASAAIAAYPELSCFPNESKEVVKKWGVFKDIYCPTDYTFEFLENVLKEVLFMFPNSPYIHIGGDEAPKESWEKSPFVQKLMKKLNIKTTSEVQIYFVNKIEKIIRNNGKVLLGWDEILDGGNENIDYSKLENNQEKLSKTAVVMSWRGERGGIAAAKQGHNVVMTPTTHLYLDYYQDTTGNEPLGIGGFVNVNKVYSYNPLSKELNPEEQKFIIGTQANLWTEYIVTDSHLEYMIFPRLIALSEVGWTNNENKEFEDFKKRLQQYVIGLDARGVNYAKHIIEKK